MSKKLYFIFLVTVFTIFSAFSQEIEMPIIDSVTVNPENNSVSIGWHVTNSAAVDGYIIKKQVYNIPGVFDGTYNNIAIIDNPAITYFTDTSTVFGLALPATQSCSYNITAYKKANGNFEYSQMSNPHGTIFFDKLSFDACNVYNHLVWNEYKGWDKSDMVYSVFFKSDSMPNFKKVENLFIPDSSCFHAEDITEFSPFFKLRFLYPNTNYFYYVKAVNKNNGYTSTSNLLSVKTGMQTAPNLSATSVVVSNKNEIQTTFKIKPINDTLVYKVLRKQIGNMQTDTLLPESIGSEISVFSTGINDTLVYQFILTVSSPCGNVLSSSDYIQNVVLKQIETETEAVYIQWGNPFTLSSGYSIIYRLKTDNTLEQLAMISESEIYNYSEDVALFTTDELKTFVANGMLRYQVHLFDIEHNTIAISNVLEVPYQVDFLTATAINPYSLVEQNRIFKPVIPIANNYKMMIYNRWGDIIFSTNDYLNGWDGREKNGNYATEGSYVYYVEYKNSKDKMVKRTGYVSLIFR